MHAHVHIIIACGGAVYGSARRLTTFNCLKHNLISFREYIQHSHLTNVNSGLDLTAVFGNCSTCSSQSPAIIVHY